MGIFSSAVLDVASVVLENHKQENNRNNRPNRNSNRLNFYNTATEIFWNNIHRFLKTCREKLEKHHPSNIKNRSQNSIQKFDKTSLEKISPIEIFTSEVDFFDIVFWITF
jgi:hypothetical protein